MNSEHLFAQWRTIKEPEQSWGLAWFLASEFCKRFYASHGLVPWVISREGLGFYGITINKLPCSVHSQSGEPLGRFTMGGDVENWRTGGPGDHGCELMKKCAAGIPTEELVHLAIAHLGLPPVPEKSHLSCRHKRRGASYQLCFEIATLVALRYEPDEIEIWNHPADTRSAKTDDPKRQMKEPPGAFLFVSDDRRICVSGEGLLLDGSGLNLWHEYMTGKAVMGLSDIIIQKLHKKNGTNHAKANAGSQAAW